MLLHIFLAVAICANPIPSSYRKDILGGAAISSVPNCKGDTCACADDLVAIKSATASLQTSITSYQAGQSTAAQVMPTMIMFIKAQQGM